MIAAPNAFDSDGPLGGVGIGYDAGSRLRDGGADALGRGVVEVVDFLDIVDEGVRLALPVVVETGGGKGFGGGELHGELAHVVVVVEIVLPPIGYDIPVATDDVAVGIDIAKALAVHQPTGVDEAFAYLFPPLMVLVELLKGGEAVPWVVHHLGAAVEVGAETEVVLRDVVNHRLVFGLQGVERVGAEGVGVVAVEVDIVGIVAHGAGDGVVAAAVGAVGVGEGVDGDAGAVEEVGDVGRGAVAAEQGVAKAEHEVEARHLVAVHGGGVEELGAVEVVVGRACDGQREDKAALHGGADGVDVAERGEGVDETLHHGKVDFVGGVTVPRVHLLKGGCHLYCLGREGVGDGREGVGTGFLRHGGD